MLGPGRPSPEQEAAILDLLDQTEQDIRYKGTETRIAGERVLIHDDLTHWDVARGYMQLAIHLGRRGDDQRAKEIILEKLCSFDVYGRLPTPARQQVQNLVRGVFQENYLEIKAKLLDNHEMMIRIINRRRCQGDRIPMPPLDNHEMMIRIINLE